MTLTLLIVCGIALTTAVFAVASRVDETVDPLVTGGTTTDATVVGLDAADTLTGTEKPAMPTRTDWQVRTVSALCDAESLLDSLERQGIAERELVILGNASFAVRWR